MKKKITHTLSRLLLGICLGSCLFVVAAQEAEEEAVSGRELLADCEGATQPTRACMQYVFGLVQTVVMLQQMEPGQQQLFCIDPTLISLEEVTGKVTSYLKNAPERLDEDAYVLVSEALNTNYPCPVSDII